GVRLVRGSHIVTKRLYEHEKCYFFQGTDGRIIFAIPYETDFTLIGTTDADHSDASVEPHCTPEEQRYLIDFVNNYLAKPISDDDVVWTYSGVRPLYDDGATSATAATRDYVLELDQSRGAPALNVFGGKITTYRRLAESALQEIGTVFESIGKPWTAGVPLPGGDFPVDGVIDLVAELQKAHPFMDHRWALRLVRAYGSEAKVVMEGAESALDLGEDFGATLTEREVAWLMQKEYARTAEDVVWRRSKLGLRMSADQIDRLNAWMQDALGVSQTAAAE
ncbi:MAG: glycerol-3-phosphate dehydrogenase, partial [Pseudomonadota bacterium]